jgi:chloride channel 3/4/5
LVTEKLKKDFLLDAHQHRLDNKNQKIQFKQQRWIGGLKKILWDSQGWIVLFAVGCATAVTTAFIQSAAIWLIGLRKGVCSLGVFIDKSNCCLEQASDTCANWKTWTEYMTGDRYIYGDYAIYVLSAVLLAVLSGFMTLIFSEKAAGGGIPEVKSVLGGFIFRQILGAWVLFIKTIGIVSSRI